MRNFFEKKDYLEVDTPTLSTHLIPEPTIKNFESIYDDGYNNRRSMYLIPSPEVFMKELIGKGVGSVYQFSKCFRNSEQIGEIHNPEFTMLEYYSMDMDEQDSIQLTEQLLKETALPNAPDYIFKPFKKLTVNEAIYHYAEKIDLDNLQKPYLLREAAKKLGLASIPDNECWEDTFNRIFINFVEPNLPKDIPVLLDKYPQQIECLASRDGNYRKRWELYINGVEVANCYKEETNENVIDDYYRKEYTILSSERAITGEVIPDIDPNYPKIFSSDYPHCSGVAMGMDRLLMLEMNKKDIRGVILFPFSDMLVKN